MESIPSSREGRRAYAIGLAVCAVVLFIFASFAMSEPTYAAGDFGLGKAVGETQLPKDEVAVVIGRVINAALSLVGIIFLVLMLYAGIRWMTARGNAEYAEKAKDTIMRAVIGLIIVASAYAITSFVISRVSASGDSGSNTSASASTCVAGRACETDADCNGGGCTEDKQCFCLDT